MKNTDLKVAKNKNGVYEYERGSKIPWYSIIATIITIVGIFLLKYAKYLNIKINYVAMMLSTTLFAFTMFFVERISLERGYWAWNKSKMFAGIINNLYIYGIPLEEVFVVYFIAPPITIILYLIILRIYKNE